MCCGFLSSIKDNDGDDVENYNRKRSHDESKLGKNIPECQHDNGASNRVKKPYPVLNNPRERKPHQPRENTNG